MSDLNLAAAHEAIAAAVGDRECLAWRGRRWSYAEVTDRSRRLGAVLCAAGLGLHRDRAGLGGSESGQDHLALYLHNGNEYLEAMLGAYKARVAPFNVNWRYTAEELAYVLADARPAAVVLHSAFAPTYALALEMAGAPRPAVVAQVDDGSGNPLVDGAVWYEDALATAVPVPPQGLSPDDLYVLYTGGTTGRPKGVLWRQGDFAAGALGVRAASYDELADAAVRSGGRLRALPSPPFMHGAAHWNAWSCWLAGGTVIVQSQVHHFDPADVLATAAAERATSLQVVGDALARPLVDELYRHSYDLSALRFVVSGGAVLSPALKAELVAAVPGLTIIDILGSSESGRQAVAQSSAGRGIGSGTFSPEEAATVLDADLTRELAAGDDAVGWLAQRGRIPLGYLNDPGKTARTFPVVGGERWVVPGDRARRRADGSIELLGRDSVTINTGGEKVFAEEVETAVKTHPGVYDALVVGRPSPRWGQEVVAIVALRPGYESVGDDELREACAAHIARYKLPKVIVRRDHIGRFPSGKPDYAWARDQAR